MARDRPRRPARTRPAHRRPETTPAHRRGRRIRSPRRRRTTPPGHRRRHHLGHLPRRTTTTHRTKSRTPDHTPAARSRPRPPAGSSCSPNPQYPSTPAPQMRIGRTIPPGVAAQTSPCANPGCRDHLWGSSSTSYDLDAFVGQLPSSTTMCRFRGSVSRSGVLAQSVSRLLRRSGGASRGCARPRSWLRCGPGFHRHRAR